VSLLTNTRLMSAVLLVAATAGIVLGLVLGNAGVVSGGVCAALAGVCWLVWPGLTGGGR
jgi:hypothetical protein